MWNPLHVRRWRAATMQKSHAFLKESWSYACMKIVFQFLLLTYIRCDVPASFAPRHTTMCLNACFLFYNLLIFNPILSFFLLRVFKYGQSMFTANFDSFLNTVCLLEIQTLLFIIVQKSIMWFQFNFASLWLLFRDDYTFSKVI